LNKSSSVNYKFLEKSDIAIICMSGMVAGFLFSRVALSISTFFFGINAIRDINPKEWLKQKWWIAGLAWVAIYALTWFWTEDKGNWGTRLEVKLPFLLLPLAFAFLPRFTAKQLQLFTLVSAFLFLGGAIYTVSFLVADSAANIKKYRYAEVLPTLPKNDHIRASLAVALFIVWCFYLWPMLKGAAKWVITAIAAFLIIYLHILAVKSGLLSLYIFGVGWGLYMAIAKRKLAGIIAIILIPLFLTLAIKFMPTLRERANYVYFSWFMFKLGDKSGNYGDINRLMSYKIAFNLIKDHPLTGVGTGDMLAEMTKGFHKWNPDLPEQSVILPHNQFLTVALGCGIPAMVLFLIWVFMPLAALKKNRQGFFFFMVWFLLFLQLMIEPVLEVQFGVFVILFFLLLQKHEMDGAAIDIT